MNKPDGTFCLHIHNGSKLNSIWTNAIFINCLIHDFQPAKEVLKQTNMTTNPYTEEKPTLYEQMPPFLTCPCNSLGARDDHFSKNYVSQLVKTCPSEQTGYWIHYKSQKRQQLQMDFMKL
jgi:hypothetical protein